MWLGVKVNGIEGCEEQRPFSVASDTSELLFGTQESGGTPAKSHVAMYRSLWVAPSAPPANPRADFLGGFADDDGCIEQRQG